MNIAPPIFRFVADNEVMTLQMEKHYLSPVELLDIATQHAYSAEHLLGQQAKYLTFDKLWPVTTLIYQAFMLTFKAYALHEHRPVKHYKSLREWVELNSHLGFSNQELILFKTLAKQQTFVKGLDYHLWETPQQLHVFCEQLLNLYERLQQLMPLELQSDYQSF